MKPPRVVLDTNCLVSALLFQNGRLAPLRHAWQSGGIRPLVCQQTVSELIRVLGYPKFRLSKEDIDSLLEDFLPFTEVWQTELPDQPVPELADASDAVFVHLARQAAADALVSGDVHLLQLPDIGITILSPADFLRGLPRTR